MFLGVEIGGTKLQVGVGDRQGRLQQLERAAVVRRAGAAGIRRQLAVMIPPLLQQYRVRAIGVGFGGPVDAVTGRAVTSHQIAGWDNYPLQRWFEREFGLPASIENDTNLAALAEALVGAGKGKRVVFYSNVGTGIGGGLVMNGQIYNGRFGALEIGHTRFLVCGRWRILEELASGLSIERGKTTLAQAARYYGAALANAITLLNPDLVIVGGGVARAGVKFFQPVRATAKRLVIAPYRQNYRIVPAALGETVVVVGAVLLARQGGLASREQR